MWEWKTYECAYCLDTVTTEWISDFWDLKLPCKHQHCGNCLSRYYKHSIKDLPFKPVVCCSPTARLPLRFLQRRLGLSSHEVAEYRSKLAELDTTVKLYCSDPKCGAFIPQALRTGRTARCRRCNSGTCVRCRERAHTKNSCSLEAAAATGKLSTFMASEKKFESLARQRGWKQCPSCNRWTEKTEGCNRISCPCGTHWCYRCGYMPYEYHVQHGTCAM